MSKLRNIFEHTDCLTEQVLVKYISGKLSSAEKHKVEVHLADCALCSDAAEGLAMIPDKQKISDITSELNRKISGRSEKRPVKVIFLQQYRTQLAVAASIVLVLGMVWFFRSNMSMKEMDPAAAEEMFADKFEPYPSETPATTDESEQSPAPVTSSTEILPDDNLKSIVSDREQAVAGKEGAKSNLQTEEAQKGKDPASSENFGWAGNAISEKGEQAAPEEEKALEDSRNKLAEEVQKKSLATPADGKYRDDADLAKEKETSKDEYYKSKKDEDKKAQAPAMTGAGTTTAATIPTADKTGKMEEKKNRNENTERAAVETKSQAAEGDVLAFSSDKQTKKKSKLAKEAPKKVSGGYYETTTISNTTTAPQSQAVSQDIVLAQLDTAKAEIPVTNDTAMKKYNNKDYAGAAGDFEKVLKKSPNDEKALFYSAVSYLSLGQTDKAMVNLNKVLLNKTSEYYEAAQWYLSLAYIKNNDTKNARSNLTIIQNNSNHRYKQQADETLKQLNK